MGPVADEAAHDPGVGREPAVERAEHDHERHPDGPHDLGRPEHPAAGHGPDPRGPLPQEDERHEVVQVGEHDDVVCRPGQ
jgi:hypothetical protein